MFEFLQDGSRTLLHRNESPEQRICARPGLAHLLPHRLALRADANFGSARVELIEALALPERPASLRALPELLVQRFVKLADWEAPPPAGAERERFAGRADLREQIGGRLGREERNLEVLSECVASERDAVACRLLRECGRGVSDAGD